MYRRPDYSKERALSIINSQMSLLEKEKLADWLLVSNTEAPFSGNEGYKQVEILYKKVLYPSKLSTIFWVGLIYSILFYFCFKLVQFSNHLNFSPLFLSKNSNV